MVSVLGVDVDHTLLAAWRDWIAPARQPFLVEPGTVADAESEPRLTPELRDTYTMWRVAAPIEVWWLGEAEFAALPRTRRAALVRAQVTRRRGAVPTVRRWADHPDHAAIRAQADGHRFVWWPSLLPTDDHAALARIVETGEHASRHQEVGAETWARCARLLPAAAELAGTFPRSSGPNCFGTVMAAAGVADAADDWVLEDAFTDWLTARSRPGGTDDAPGTVLVWSAHDGRPVHAAVTLGDGWALEKPSQCWWTPRTVLPVADVVRLNRASGQRLSRHVLT